MGNESSLLNTLESMTCCRIVVIGPKSGDDSLVELARLPQEARIIATGCNVEELRRDGNMFSEVSSNCVLFSYGAFLPLIADTLIGTYRVMCF